MISYKVIICSTSARISRKNHWRDFAFSFSLNYDFNGVRSELILLLAS